MKVMETTAAIYLRKSTEDDGKSVANAATRIKRISFVLRVSEHHNRKD